MRDLSKLPDGLPVPVDDGACSHLPGRRVPSLSLPSASGRHVDLAAVPGTAVVYFYPRIGNPHAPPPAGWNEIPGARGCTPQSCAFRDAHADLVALGAEVYGVSAQPLAEQQEATARLELPFELLNDRSLELARAMRLPTFEHGGVTLIKRLTVIATGGRIEKVFYPVFPPDRSAIEVVDWLRSHPRQQ
jgi:peroxiredoxin